MTNRPRRYHKNRKNVCFALPIEYIDALRNISQKYDISFSDAARYAIKQYLKGIKYV